MKLMDDELETFQNMGLNNPGFHMGALENLALELSRGADNLANSISYIAEAIENLKKEN